TAALLVPGTSEGGARARRRQEAPRQAGGDPRADGAARDGPRHGRGQTRPGMSDAARLPVPPGAPIMDALLRGRTGFDGGEETRDACREIGRASCRERGES